MKDLNFFEPYIEKRNLKFNKAILLYTFFTFLILAIAAYGVYNQLTIKALQADIRDRKEVAENPKTLEKVNEIKALEEEVNNFRQEVQNIVDLDQAIEERDIIGDEFLKSIKNKMPDDLFLTTFSAHGNEVQLSGISKDKYSVAEFGNALMGIENSDEFFISNIVQTEDYYKFDLNLTVKDVINDGKDPN